MMGEVLAALDRKEEALTHLKRAVKLAGDTDPNPARTLKHFREKWGLKGQ
jgi:hypothetical protein